MKTAVSYLRVSTKGQSVSGLGVDAQRAAVAGWCAANDHKLIDEYVEIESGRNLLRLGLHDAMARAKGTQSILVIARLDRLARSSRFIAELLDSDLRFVAVDVPNANRLVLQILAAVAEDEARATSIRTRAALAAAKARGVVLGRPENLGGVGTRAAGGRASVIVRRRKRDALIATVERRIHYLRSEGFGFRAIASVLNEEHYRGIRGNKWKAQSVWDAWRRIKERGSIA
jgi:DNA invertase Pin-like site-specific DNA recombinase